MQESGYYPAGAEHDPQAPWNEPLIPDREFEVCISQSLSKNLKVVTNNYVQETCVESWNGICKDNINTSDTNWNDVYKEQGHLTPLELIQCFKDLLVLNLEEAKKDAVSDNAELAGLAGRQIKRFEHLISECENWTNDETEIVEN